MHLIRLVAAVLGSPQGTVNREGHEATKWCDCREEWRTIRYHLIPKSFKMQRISGAIPSKLSVFPGYCEAAKFLDSFGNK